MSQEQDYKVVETPEKKHKVKIRTYVTGGDDIAVKKIITSATHISIDDDEKSNTAVDADVELKVDEVLIDRFVIDVNGKSERIRETLEDFPLEDYNFVIEELRKATKKISLDQAKKN